MEKGSVGKGERGSIGTRLDRIQAGMDKIVDGVQVIRELMQSSSKLNREHRHPCGKNGMPTNTCSKQLCSPVVKAKRVSKTRIETLNCKGVTQGTRAHPK